MTFIPETARIYGFSWRIATGQMKTPVSGKIRDLKVDGYKSLTRATVVGNFLRYKMAPVSSAVWKNTADMTGGQ